MHRKISAFADRRASSRPAMSRLALTSSPFDFSAVHACLQEAVDARLIAGASHAVLRGQDLVDLRCTGLAHIESGEAMREDHLFRVFSNTKLFTSIAVMRLVEQQRLDLDEPVQRHLPALADLRVLRPGATQLDDTEPARAPITARHLLTHTAGLSYGLFDPASPLFAAYQQHRILNARETLAQMVEHLGELPLAFHPGTAWTYSVATDVLSRLVEVVCGEPFGDALRRLVLDPLALQDTGFVVPPDQQHRLAGYYQGASLKDPMKPGLRDVGQTQPYPGAYRQAVPRQSGGGGLVSSLGDMVTLMRCLLAGGAPLLQPPTLAELMRDQLPPSLCITFPMSGPMPWRGHGLAGCVFRSAGPSTAPGVAGEFSWGGIAGTQWWIHPRTGTAGVLMVQRVMADGHPALLAFRRRVYEAIDR